SFFQSYRDPRDLHSFPTRRSSDLFPTRCSKRPRQPASRRTSRIGWNIRTTTITGKRFRLKTTTRISRCRCSEWARGTTSFWAERSEEHTSELQSRGHLVCRLLLEK